MLEQGLQFGRVERFARWCVSVFIHKMLNNSMYTL
jgi:hypothetical protein